MITLTLPFAPSVNTYWRHLSKGALAGRTLISETGRRYRTAVLEIVAQRRFKAVLEGSLSVDIEVMPPDRRKRDLDNLPKAVLDALTHARVWHDDGQIDDLRIWRSRQHPGGQIILTITPIAAAQPSLLEAV